MATGRVRRMATAAGDAFWLVEFYRDAPKDGLPVVGYDEMRRLMALRKRPEEAARVLNAVVLVKDVFPGATVTQCIVHPKKRQRKLTAPATQREAL